MVRALADKPLSLQDLAPLYRHTFYLPDGHPFDPIRTLSKFREVDTSAIQNLEIIGYEVNELRLSEIIDPPILHDAGFYAYIRTVLGEKADDLPKAPVLPDLWFGLTPIKPDAEGFWGNLLGVVEIVDTNDIARKWDVYVDFLDMLDTYLNCWLCLLRREVHSAFYFCEMLL